MKKASIIILAISCWMIAGTISAKPTLEIKQLNSFSLAELSLDPSFSDFCITDSLIIAVDTADSSAYKTYCYDYQGNKVQAFSLPTHPKYRQPFFINYLFGKKQIAIQNWYGIDYYNVKGDSVGHKAILDDDIMFAGEAAYLGAYEHQGIMEYKYWRVLEAASHTFPATSSYTWLEEKVDGQLQPIRKCYYDWDPIQQRKQPKHFLNWKFLLDTNTDKQMVYVEETKDKFLARFYVDSLTFKFELKKHKKDHLNIIKIGENFLVLMTADDNFNPTKTSGIYDLKGYKIGSLTDFKELYSPVNDKGVVDIVGNKAFVMNYKDKVMSIYEVRLIQD